VATAVANPARPEATRSRIHWAEYGMEAALLGGFMVSACGFTVLLFHPASPAVQAIPSEFVRRWLTGLAMGATAIALIYSPWGRRSGAHFNPAVTLTFLRLGKVAPHDAAGYVLAQFVGGWLGVVLSAEAAGALLADSHVHYAATLPGPAGPAVAWAAEFAITFLLMSVILRVSNSGLARFTGIAAGVLVATYITFEAPLSGMSMNPARTFASALGAHDWTALWVYFTAPPLGMLAAAEVYVRTRGPKAVFCAKLQHDGKQHCLFCEYWRERTGAGTISRSRTF